VKEFKPYKLYDNINRPTTPTDHRNYLAVDAFLEALDNEYYEMRVRDKYPKDLKSAMQAALLIYIEAYSTSRHRSHTEPEGNYLSIPTKSNDRMPSSKMYWILNGRTCEVLVSMFHKGHATDWLLEEMFSVYK